MPLLGGHADGMLISVKSESWNLFFGVVAYTVNAYSSYGSHTLCIPKHVQHTASGELNWTGVQRDNVPWLGVMQEQYLKVAVGAIKKYDPHHLILGMRGQNTGFWAYPEGIVAFPGLLNATAAYVDVFDFHTYEDLPEMEYMAEIYEAIDKPILLGEFSFIAWDSNLPNG